MVRDNEVKAGLAAAGVHCQSFNAEILREPWEVLAPGGKVGAGGGVVGAEAVGAELGWAEGLGSRSRS